jgi:acyl-CoA dehydrogenase
MYILGTVLRRGSDPQIQQYLPALADGSLTLQAFGVTEPTSGTDTTALRTVAQRDRDQCVVNGQKIWTSRAEFSDLMLLLTRTIPLDQCVKKTDGLSVFLEVMREVRGKSLTITPI